MMKALLLIALVVCTGCQANLFSADEPKPQLQQLSDVFKRFFDQTRRSADETIEKIRTSQVGQEINQFTTDLKEKMDPLMTKISEGAEQLRERIEGEVSVVRCALKPYIEAVTDPFEKGADYIRDSLNLEDMKATFVQKSEELRENLEKSAKELQEKLNPST